MTNSVLAETSDGVLTITLNRPEKHNAVEAEGLAFISRLLDDEAHADKVRAIVITGAGDKTFCAGASLDEIAGGSDGGGTGRWANNPLSLVTDKLEHMPQPTICALNGSVYGGGVEIAMACDFRMARRGIRSFVPPARFGIHYPPNGLRLMATRLGVTAAKRLLLAGETFEEEALRACGFVDWWVEDNAALTQAAHARASEMAGFAPLAVQGMKQALNDVANARFDEAAVAARAAICWASEDLQEGLAAHKQGRKPVFKSK